MKDFVSSEMMVNRNDDEFEVNIEGWIIYSVDTNYGADADGNRGVKKIFAEDIEDLTAYTVDGDDFELTTDEREQAEDILTHKFLNQ